MKFNHNKVHRRLCTTYVVHFTYRGCTNKTRRIDIEES